MPSPVRFPVPSEIRKQGSGAMYRYKWEAYPEFQARERERQQRYKHANPDVAARWGKRHKVQIQAQADGSLSPVVVRRLFAEARHCPCPYCGRQYSTSNPMVLDHIEPISRGGRHAIGNVGVVCKQCNREKWAHPITEWIARLPRERRSLASAYVDTVRAMHMGEAV